MSDKKLPETIVELKDDYRARDAAGHKTRHVYINGVKVLVEADSVVLVQGENEITKVMLTLLPKEVRLNTEDSNE